MGFFSLTSSICFFLSHLLTQASQASPDPIFVTNPPNVQTSLHGASLDRCPKSKWCIIFGVQNQNDASKSKCLIFAVLQPRYLAPPGCAGLIINISYWSGGVLKSKLNGSLTNFQAIVLLVIFYVSVRYVLHHLPFHRALPLMVRLST